MSWKKTFSSDGPEPEETVTRLRSRIFCGHGNASTDARPRARLAVSLVFFGPRQE